MELTVVLTMHSNHDTNPRYFLPSSPALIRKKAELYSKAIAHLGHYAQQLKIQYRKISYLEPAVAWHLSLN